MTESTSGAPSPEHPYTIPDLAHAMGYRLMHDLTSDLSAAWQEYGVEAQAPTEEMFAELVANYAQLHEGLLGAQPRSYTPTEGVIRAYAAEYVEDGTAITDEAVKQTQSFLTDPDVNPSASASQWQRLHDAAEREVARAEVIAQKHQVAVPQVYLQDDLYSEFVRASRTLSQFAEAGLGRVESLTLENAKDIFSSYLINAAGYDVDRKGPLAELSRQEIEALFSEQTGFGMDGTLFSVLERLYVDPNFLANLEHILNEAKAVASIVLGMRIARHWGKNAHWAVPPKVRKSITARKQYNGQAQPPQDLRAPLMVGETAGNAVIDAQTIETVLAMTEDVLVTRMILGES